MKTLNFFRKTTNSLSSCEVALADGLLKIVWLGSMNGNSSLHHFVSPQNGENLEKVTEKKSCGTEMKH